PGRQRPTQQWRHHPAHGRDTRSELLGTQHQSPGPALTRITRNPTGKHEMSRKREPFARNRRGKRRKAMVIQWQGHACFRVSGDGVRIVTDPYTPEVAGLSPIREAADIVIMSSDDDPFHSDAGDVPGRPLVLNALE